MPLETLNSVVRDIEQSEEGCEEQQDVEYSGKDRDKEVGNLQYDPLEVLESTVEGDHEDDVAEADAQQGNQRWGAIQ